MLASFLVIQGCVDMGQKGKEEEKEKKAEPVVVVTENMEFQSVDTIPSGWHTFFYKNKSYENHFFLLDKYPVGKTLKDGETEVMPVFQDAMDLINEGKSEEGFAELSNLPEWYFNVVFTGGTGLISPGKTAQTTLRMEPGYYVMECYVKMANGMFHSTMGMVKSLIVTGDTVETSEPAADVELSVSSTGGITYDDDILKGEQTFSVFFKDQIAHENFVGHDVHLVKLGDEADLAGLEMWMNWANPGGLQTPAPEGLTFLGGVNDLPAGSKGYFTATLEPGNYAFVSEVPMARGKNMLKTFVVLN